MKRLHIVIGDAGYLLGQGSAFDIRLHKVKERAEVGGAVSVSSLPVRGLAFILRAIKAIYLFSRQEREIRATWIRQDISSSVSVPENKGIGKHSKSLALAHICSPCLIYFAFSVYHKKNAQKTVIFTKKVDFLVIV